jgi:hypothetical protein
MQLPFHIVHIAAKGSGMNATRSRKMLDGK